MEIEVWSDIVCPWCYIGNVRLKQAIDQLDDPNAIAVRTRSFELDPFAPVEPRPNLERLAEKYGVSAAEARAMEDRVAAQAAASDAPFEYERPSANSFDLHRLVWLAREFELGEALFDRLQYAFFGKGENVFDHATLAHHASELGLPSDRVTALLSGDEFESEVRADEERAHEIGVTGVPFAVLAGKWAIPGAASAEQYRDAIERILQETRRS